jgi:hypothetical protein
MPTRDRSWDPYPASKASLDRLRRAGWSVAEYTIWLVSHRALGWIVVGELGRERLLTMGSTRGETARRACLQAETIE